MRVVHGDGGGDAGGDAGGGVAVVWPLKKTKSLETDGPADAATDKVSLHLD